jgi:predicted transposase/invertase (TIGR01784 family)
LAVCYYCPKIIKANGDKMIQIIHQPADKFFKEAMTTIHVAKEFIEKNLKGEFLKQVTLPTLKVVKETFINKAFRKKEADLVYSVRINGNLGYFYILCEHQGKVDKMMAFRLWQYIILLIEFHLRQHPDESLPIVYPIVVYTGTQKWNAPLEIFDLFGENKELARKIFNLPYQLIDIQRISDEDLRKNLRSGLVKYVLKYQKNRANVSFLKNLFKDTSKN